MMQIFSFSALIFSLFLFGKDGQCQSTDFYALFKNCNDYKKNKKGAVMTDTVRGMNIYMSEAWQGDFEGEMPNLFVQNQNPSDTVHLEVYEAYDAVNNHFEMDIKDRPRFKLFRFNGKKTMIIPRHYINGREGIEIHYGLNEWIITLIIAANKEESLREVLCDTKSVIWQYEVFYSSKMK